MKTVDKLNAVLSRTVPITDPSYIVGENNAINKLDKIFKSIEAIQKRKLIHIFMVKSQRRWYNNCIKQQTAKVLTAILSITVASAGRLLRGWCDYEH